MILANLTPVQIANEYALNNPNIKSFELHNNDGWLLTWYANGTDKNTKPNSIFHIKDNIMATTNPITGDKIQTKPSDKYADNYDAIFRKDHHNELLKDDEMGFSADTKDNQNGSKVA